MIKTDATTHERLKALILSAPLFKLKKIYNMPISEVFNMDCMEYMRQFPDKHFELAVVDPPYGESDAINPVNNRSVHKANRRRYREFDNTKPSAMYFAELARVSKNQIVS